MKNTIIITILFIILLICCIANMGQEVEIQKKLNTIEEQKKIIDWQDNQIRTYKENLKDLMEK